MERLRGQVWLALPVVALVVALSGYFLLLGNRALVLLRDGRPALVVLGLAVLAIPLIGVWIVWTTISAGLAHQRLAGRAVDEGCDLDVSSLPMRASGRIEREAADELFEQVKAEYEANPQDWRKVYRLARAYDYAGDRSRAREFMKQAVALYDHSPSP